MIINKFASRAEFDRFLKSSVPSGPLIAGSRLSELARQRKVATDRVIEVAGEYGLSVPVDDDPEVREIFAQDVVRRVLDR